MKREKSNSRSALVRKALQEFLRIEKTRRLEEAECRIWREHRDLVERQASAMVAEQAEP
jgi:hypothetical protein